MLKILRTVCLLPLLSILSQPAAANHDLLELAVDDHDFTIDRFSSARSVKSDHLLLWLDPGVGNTDRVFAAAHKLAEAGVETWHIDLPSNLFLPRSTHTMRTLDGTHVSRLIDTAHHITGKSVTLISRAYGALPVLHGARSWQLSHQNDEANFLTGAILFSPELYSRIPPLGQAAEYMPIASATSVPVMLVQAGKRGNRWQLGDLIEQLESGGSAVTVKLIEGVTGVFYHEDVASETLAYNERIDKEISRFIKLLNSMPTTKTATPIQSTQVERKPLDIDLRRATTDFTPPPLSLPLIDGDRYERSDYTGQITVVNFWASWCGPCVEEIPALNNLRSRMQDEPFELISVNYAESEQTVRDFMGMVKVDFPVLMDSSGEISADWKVLVYPATYVIAPDGKFAYAVNGAIQWDSDDIIEQLNALND